MALISERVLSSIVETILPKRRQFLEHAHPLPAELVLATSLILDLLVDQ